MQSKTPDEIEAILKQWYGLEEQYNQTTYEKSRFFTECYRLRRKICHHQAWCNGYLRWLPSIIERDDLPTQLQELDAAMSHDQKAGEATWTLYETQKKLIRSCNAFEELITFRMEYFVLTKGDHDEIQLGMLTLASARHFLRALGPGVVGGSHPWYVLGGDASQHL